MICFLYITWERTVKGCHMHPEEGILIVRKFCIFYAKYARTTMLLDMLHSFLPIPLHQQPIFVSDQSVKLQTTPILRRRWRATALHSHRCSWRGLWATLHQCQAMQQIRRNLKHDQHCTHSFPPERLLLNLRQLSWKFCCALFAKKPSCFPTMAKLDQRHLVAPTPGKFHVWMAQFRSACDSRPNECTKPSGSCTLWHRRVGNESTDAKLLDCSSAGVSTILDHLHNCTSSTMFKVQVTSRWHQRYMESLYGKTILPKKKAILFALEWPCSKKKWCLPPQIINISLDKWRTAQRLHSGPPSVTFVWGESKMGYVCSSLLCAMSQKKGPVCAED